MTLRAGDSPLDLLLARARALLARMTELLENVRRGSASRSGRSGRRPRAALPLPASPPSPPQAAAGGPMPPRIEQFRQAVVAAANRGMINDARVVTLLRALERDGYRVMTAIGVAVNYQEPERRMSAEITEADRAALRELGIAVEGEGGGGSAPEPPKSPAGGAGGAAPGPPAGGP